MQGALKKLKIEAYSDAEMNSKVDEFDVMFNPKTYSLKYAVEYEEDQGRGTSGLPQKYKQTKPSEFGLDFTLDGTGASADKVEVSDEIDHFLKVVHEYRGEDHKPPYLRLSWGTLLFNCVFKGAGVKYSLFHPDGRPLRATVSASFLGFVEDAKRVAQERAASPDLTHMHVVTDGETLPLLTHRYYGNMALYPNVARFNGLHGFSRLVGGQRLMFPPLAKT